jgi:hypothetical protein
LRPPDADEYELQPPLSVVEVDTCVEAADGVGAGAAVYTASAQAPPEGMPVLAQAANGPLVEHVLVWPALW